MIVNIGLKQSNTETLQQLFNFFLFFSEQNKQKKKQSEHCLDVLKDFFPVKSRGLENLIQPSQNDTLII